MDWTDNYSRVEISNLSDNIIKKTILRLKSIYNEEYPKLNLNLEEVDIILRPSINIAVVTFLERLITVENNIIKKKIYDKIDLKSYFYPNYENLINVLNNYYNNYDLNIKLLSEVNMCFIKNINLNEYEIINFRKKYNNKINRNHIKSQKIIDFLENILLKILNKIKIYFNKILYKKKNKILYEQSKWLNIIFDKENIIPEHKLSKSLKNIKIRNKIIFETKFILEEEIKKFNIFKLKLPFDSLNGLFGNWIEKSIPFSLLENIDIKIKYYLRFITIYKPSSVHSAIGLYLNENFKIISLLSKRLKIPLIGHDHGTNNFINNYPKNNYIPNFTKNMQAYNSIDMYISWGKNELCDFWENVDLKNNIKICNIGSVYLHSLKKKKTNTINYKNKIKLLYIASPSRTFMASFNEISTNDNIEKNKNIVKFLKLLLDKYHNLEIIYKNFTGDYSLDDIHNNLYDYFDQNKIKISYQSPVKLMYDHDILLTDMVSTVFAEANIIGIPTLVFSNRFDYSLCSNFGKKINDDLEKKQLLFYDTNKGLENFEYLLENYNDYYTNNENIFKKYEDAIAYPIDKINFKEKLKNKINKFF